MAKIAALPLESIAPLLGALDDPEPDVRTAALRALVRLPLAREAWVAVSRRVGKVLAAACADVPAGQQLAMSEHVPLIPAWRRALVAFPILRDLPARPHKRADDRQDRPPAELPALARTVGGIPYVELVNAAVFIPTREARSALARMYVCGTQAERRAVAHALARVHEAYALRFLAADLQHRDGNLRLLAAQSLAYLNPAPVRTELYVAFLFSPDDYTRFWAAVALARVGETRPLAQALDWFHWTDDLPGYFPGEEDRLEADLHACGSYPDNARQLFDAVLRKYEARGGHPIAGCLARAAEPPALAGAAPQSATSAPPAFSSEDAVERAQTYETSDADINELTGRLEGDRPILAWLPPARASAFVSLLFQKCAAAHTFCNPLVELVREFQIPFVPDRVALFDTYLQAKENSALRYQIVWTMTRGGLDRLLDDLSPALASDAPETRAAAARLVEDAARYATHNYPPLFGGGSAPADVTPPAALFGEDEQSRPTGTAGQELPTHSGAFPPILGPLLEHFGGTGKGTAGTPKNGGTHAEPPQGTGGEPSGAEPPPQETGAEPPVEPATGGTGGREPTRGLKPLETRRVNVVVWDTPEDDAANWGAIAPKPTRALVVQRAAALQVSVGAPRPEAHVAAATLPATRSSKTIDLYLTLQSADGKIKVENPTQVITLPADGGSSDSASFDLTPTAETTPGRPAVLTLSIFYRTFLLQEFQFVTEIAAALDGDGRLPVASDLEQLRLLTHRLPLDVDAPLAVDARPPLDAAVIEKLPLKPVSIRVSTSEGHYLLTVMTEGRKESPDAAERPVPLVCDVNLTKEELATRVTQIRRRLLDVARDPVYLSGHKNAGAGFETYLGELAHAGRELYNVIFKPGSNASGAAVAKWLRDLEPGTPIHVTIGPGADAFTIPWNLLYDTDLDTSATDWMRFWGCRYRIEQLTDAWHKTLLRLVKLNGWDAARAHSILVGDDLDMLYGCFRNMPQRGEQDKRLEDYRTRASVPFKIARVETREDLLKTLQNCDSEILYFYCHGNAEQFDPGGRLDDPIREFLDWYAKQPPEVKNLYPATYVAALGDDNLRNRTWLKLDDGRPVELVADLLGKTCALNRNPLVFLNMCQSAMISPLLSNSFVAFFGEQKARAVIGTECAMSAAFANVFATDFFERFLGGADAGSVMLEIRRKAMSDYRNPLGLAYSLYGDADVQVERPILV